MMTRRRRWLYVALILLLLGVGASLLIRYLTRPEMLARLLVEQIEQRTGLLLRLGETPDIRLLPQLSLELRSVVLSLPGGTLLLTADALEMALPWRALREPVVSLDSLILRGAEFDLDALWALSVAAETEGPPAPLRLPPVASRLQLFETRLVSGERGFALVGLQVDSAALVDGQPWRVNARGRHRDLDTGAEQGFRLDLATTPRHIEGGLRMADVSAALELDGDPALRARLTGVLDLLLPRTSGEILLMLSRWPRELPDLPLDGDLASPVELALRWSAVGLGPGQLSMRLSRDTLEFEGEAQFGDLLGWLTARGIAIGPGSSGGLPPPPPLRGRIRIPAVNVADMQLEGITIELRDEGEPETPP